MNDSKIYRLTEGDYTPSGKWTDYPHLVDYQHMANIAAKKIRDMTDAEFERFVSAGRWTIWGGPLEIVDVTYGARVTYDADLEPSEGKYIATAIQRAIAARR